MPSDEMRAYKRDWYARHREKVRAAQQARRAANPETGAQNRASAAGSYQRKKERAEVDPVFREEWRLAQREVHLQKNYGLTSADYGRMYVEQGGGCAACGAPTSPDNPNGYLHVDHSHVTGEVRGLLCKPCNQALGLLEESVDRLMGLAAYLLRFQNVLQMDQSTGKES